MIWVRIPGGSGTSTGYGLTVKNDQIFVAGGFSGTNIFQNTVLLNDHDWQPNGFVSTLDSSGNFLSTAKIFASEGCQASVVAVDDAGNFFVSGYFAGNLSVNQTNLPASTFQARYIAQLGTNGSFLWARGFGSIVNSNDGGIAGAAKGSFLPPDSIVRFLCLRSSSTLILQDPEFLAAI